MVNLTPAGELLNVMVMAVGIPAAIAIGVVGALAIGLAFVFLASTERKTRRWAIVPALLGLLVIEACLFALREQTVTTRPSPGVVVTRPFYSSDARLRMLIVQTGLPIVVALLGAFLTATAERRLRRRIPALVQKGMKHLFQKEYDAAADAFSAAIAIDPKRADLYCKRGSVFEQRGHRDLALADFERALRHAPVMPEARLRRGAVLAAQGDLDAALADFDAALMERPGDVECHLQRGLCLAKKGQNDRAALDLERVLTLSNNPEHADPARLALLELCAASNRAEEEPSPAEHV